MMNCSFDRSSLLKLIIRAIPLGWISSSLFIFMTLALATDSRNERSNVKLGRPLGLDFVFVVGVTQAILISHIAEFECVFLTLISPECSHFLDFEPAVTTLPIRFTFAAVVGIIIRPTFQIVKRLLGVYLLPLSRIRRILLIFEHDSKYLVVIIIGRQRVIIDFSF